MRVLLSTIGSRGDVQPLVALATELTAHRVGVQLCVPPDFCAWIEGLGFSVTPIGPELRKMTAPAQGATPFQPSPEEIRRLVEDSVAAQFAAVKAAAQGCDVIVAATALQIAARSVSELLGARYVFVAYCPAVLPSDSHAPPPVPAWTKTGTPEPTDNRELWKRDGDRFNARFGDLLNAHRASAGLAPVSDVRGHIFGDASWLAADPTLGPWPADDAHPPFQPGAWLLADDGPLSVELERFLDAGDPPVYFGFGSARAAADVGRTMVAAARALGCRAIVAAGWGGLSLPDDGDDCLAIDEVNQQALFPRVAAVVHHGGAGTTTVAASGGAPQVIVPQMYDQHYWAKRVGELGIGVAHAAGTPTTESLTTALRAALQPAVASSARSVSTQVRRDGARVAAERLVAERGSR
jgi:vancomycin aglycone glucosyltransferase